MRANRSRIASPVGGLLTDRFDDRLHVGDVFLERAPSGGGEPVFGARHAAVERLVARDVLCVLELSGVDAQVAVGGLQQPLEIVERQPVVGGQRADNAETEPLVNDAIERDSRLLRADGRLGDAR